MIAEFHDYLRSRADLGDADLERISSRAVQMDLRRNQFLFSEGDVCRHKAFIVRGILRTFATRPDGSEHILQFSQECTWAIDAESYDNQIPSRYNIAAVEQSQLLLWNKVDFDQLLSEIPPLKSFAERLISRAVYNGRDRLFSALSASPEEKYNDFVRDYPPLIQRLPLRMIAAYLGISMKTLTRIRRAQITALK